MTMATRNLRDWMKYVESHTVQEGQSESGTDEAPVSTPTVSTGDRKSKETSPLTRTTRRPESWNLSETRPANGTCEVAEAGEPSSAGLHSHSEVSLPLGEWVGEPQPMPKLVANARPARPKVAQVPAQPIRAPRIRSTPSLMFLMKAFPEVDGAEVTNDCESDRAFLLERIINPELTLRETATILEVCPTTIRRYTNSGLLRHHRGKGNHRRFRLQDVLAFVREYGISEKEIRSES